MNESKKLLLHGRSMFPFMLEGDVIGYSKTDKVFPGEFVVVDSPKGSKTIHLLCSEGSKGFRNKNYDNELFDSLTIIGRVESIYFKDGGAISLRDLSPSPILTRLTELNHNRFRHHRLYSLLSLGYLYLSRRLLQGKLWF